MNSARPSSALRGLNATARLSFSLVLFGVVTVIGAGCGGPGSPPWPPTLDVNLYADRLSTIEGPQTESQLYIAVAGARVARGGLYMDLYVDIPLPEEKAMSASGDIGTGLSRRLDDPSRFIEIRTVGGAVIRLDSMRPARPPGLAVPHFRDPPTQLLNHENSRTHIIQTCMWRTGSQLEPGPYDLRLKAWPSDSVFFSRYLPDGDIQLRSEWDRIEFTDAREQVANANEVPQDSAENR